MCSKTVIVLVGLCVNGFFVSTTKNLLSLKSLESTSLVMFGGGKFWTKPFLGWLVQDYTINRTGVDGAVLHTATLFINSVSQSASFFLQIFKIS